MGLCYFCREPKELFAIQTHEVDLEDPLNHPVRACLDCIDLLRYAVVLKEG